jgi:hypothetical protein
VNADIFDAYPRAETSRFRAPNHPQLRIAVAAIEDDDVTGIDPVRILDLIPVHAPDLRPPPRVLKELPGNPPQGISSYDGIALGWVVRKCNCGN